MPLPLRAPACRRARRPLRLPALAVACALALSLTASACGHPGAPSTARAPTETLARLPLAPAARADWPMFRHDPARTGHADGSTVGASVATAWTLPAFNRTQYGAVKGSPSVADGVVYCGADTGRFVAVDAASGVPIWETHIERTSHGIHGSPAIAGDEVAIGAYDGTTYAFDRRTGARRWTHTRGYQIGSSPAIVPAWGMLFTANEASDAGGGWVVALDAGSGAEVWRHGTAAHPHSSVAVDVASRRVVVGDNVGTLHMLDAFSGEERWSRTLPAAEDEDGHVRAADVKTTPTIVAERKLVIVGAWSGRVVALDEDSGDTVWEHAAGGKIMSSTAYSRARGLVYAASPRGVLYAIDVADGSTRWAHPVAGTIVSSPAVSGDEQVVFGAGDGEVYALDGGDGHELWRIHVGGHVTGSPTLVGDRIYVTSHLGALTALVTRP